MLVPHTTITEDDACFELSVLLDENTLKPNKEWVWVTWYTNKSRKNRIEDWDNFEYLQKLYKKDEEHKEEFIKFVKENYKSDPKEVYKSYRRVYKTFKKLLKNEKVQD